jgi:DNA invertase Pin-like site-specific DNA recombinase
MAWLDLHAEVLSEFEPMSLYDPKTFARIFERFGKDAPKRKPGKRGKYRGHKRDPRLVLLKKVALQRLGEGESARAIARLIGVNRATVSRWAKEEGLKLRRNPWGRRGSVNWEESS